MKLRLYQIDAFASRAFAGNPAAVVPLDRWLPDATMQAIAAENNLSETAFFVGEKGYFQIRWMTPDRRGGPVRPRDAGLGLGRLPRDRERPDRGPLPLEERAAAGDRRRGPAGPRLPLAPAGAGGRLSRPLAPGAGRAARAAALASRDYLAVFESEEEVRALKPDVARVAALDRMAVIATAPGRDCDFVSRFFVPSLGIPEDPVTGSAHCTLVPYWSKRLGKASLFARQVSARGGELWCEDRGERVTIAGRCVKYLEGTIELPGDLRFRRPA